MTPHRFRRHACHRRRLGRAAGGVCVAVSLAVQAQAPAPAPEPDLRIEVTGSNLKRLDAETAGPVQVITRADLERHGILTAAQALDRIAANLPFNSYAESQAIGDTSQPGFAGASLRGLGYARTLVLLNGRRVANYALNSAGVDLNAIPLAALERIEVLKDGASAVYGSDAIGGIVNFITRTHVRGVEGVAYAGTSQAGGGRQSRASLSAGVGEPGRDRVQAFGTLDVQEAGGLAATDRRFARTAFIPGLIDATSGASTPANVDVPGVPGTVNPSSPHCAPPASFPTPAGPAQCRYDYVTASDIVNASRRVNAIGMASLELPADARVFVEAAWSHNEFVYRLSPTPISSATTRDGAPFLLSPSSPYYPAAFVAAQGGDPSRPVSVLWRAAELGSRISEPTSEQARIVAGLDGRTRDWDYVLAAEYNVSRVRDRDTQGWVRESRVMPILDSGIVDPFGPNTPEAIAALRTATIDGEVRSATGTTMGVNGKVARGFARTPLGAIALALGADWRRESLEQRSSDALAAGDILASGGSIPSIPERSRRVGAVYAEVELEPLPGVRTNVAVRHDRYSDFGSTTSPKLGVRWQPHATLLVRGTWGTGFRAPSLQSLYQPSVDTNTAGVWDDPLRCPVTRSATDCAVQFNARVGGNPALAPEHARQYAVGIAWSPARDVAVAVGAFGVTVSNLITTLTDQAVFTQLDRYGATNLVRGPADATRPGLPGPIVAVLLPTRNEGRQRVRGFDVDARVDVPLSWARATLVASGTYVDEYAQTQPDGSFPNFAGQRGAIGAIPRWRHHVSATLERGAYAATLAQTFQQGYAEPAPGGTRAVGAYSILDLQAQFTVMAPLVITAGARNLLDRDPPVTNQNQSFQVGYDPTYADPRGRFWYVALRYALR
jgi:iron complex outermembrane receptor protein